MRKPHFNITISPEARVMLTKLAKSRGLSRSAVLETLVREASALAADVAMARRGK